MSARTDRLSSNRSPTVPPLVVGESTISLVGVSVEEFVWRCGGVELEREIRGRPERHMDDGRKLGDDASSFMDEMEHLVRAC